MKRVYFACSIRGGRDNAAIYEQIVDYLKSRCHLLTEIFADKTLTPIGMNAASADIYQRDMSWVRSADILIAEVSTPSLGVGYEIASAEAMGKPILALYKLQDGKKLSAMIDGAPGVTVVSYSSLDEAFKAIAAILKK